MAAFPKIIQFKIGVSFEDLNEKEQGYILKMRVEEAKKGNEMGREVRKVTPNYEHPKDGYGDYIPLYDNFNDIDVSLEKYARYRCPDNFMLPDVKTEDRTWYQFFEDVTDGTPLSPPFATKEELINYLCTEGSFYHKEHPDTCALFSREAAEKFVDDEFMPSFVLWKRKK